MRLRGRSKLSLTGWEKILAIVEKPRRHLPGGFTRFVFVLIVHLRVVLDCSSRLANESGVTTISRSKAARVFHEERAQGLISELRNINKACHAEIVMFPSAARRGIEIKISLEDASLQTNEGKPEGGTKKERSTPRGILCKAASNKNNVLRPREA